MVVRGGRTIKEAHLEVLKSWCRFNVKGDLDWVPGEERCVSANVANTEPTRVHADGRTCVLMFEEFGIVV